MYAVEFETVSKDGMIYIPPKYRDELGNGKKIRLIVMYEKPLTQQENSSDIEKELEELEELFAKSNNQIIATKENVIDTNELINDIS